MAINVTLITEALDVIWTLIQNLVDNVDLIVTLVVLGVVFALLRQYGSWFIKMMNQAIGSTGKKGK